MGYEIYYLENDDYWYYKSQPTIITRNKNSKWFSTLEEARLQCYLLNKWS